MNPNVRPRRGLGRSTTAMLVLAGITASSLPIPAEASPTAPVLPLMVMGPEQTADQIAAVFIKMLDKLAEETPSGKKSARENAYAGLCAMWIGASVAGAAQIVGLTGAGAAIGALLGVELMGWGAIPSGAAGAGVGLAAGGTVVAAEWVVLGIVTIKVVDHLESKYPASAALDRGSLVGEDATMLGYRPTSSGAWTMYAGNAGTYESMLVHIIDAVFSDKVIAVADKWDEAPGLSAGAKAKLDELVPLRPSIERIAYIKKYKKVSASAKQAIPLINWASTASAAMEPVNNAMRDVWLGALGVGEVKVEVSGGKVSIKTSNALKDFGAPDMIYATLPTFDTEVSKQVSFGGVTASAKLKASLEAGPFSFNTSKAELVSTGPDAGKIRIDFSVAKDKTIAKGTVSFDADPPGPPKFEGSVSATVKTGKNMDGSVYFKVVSGLLVPDKVTFDALDPVASMGGLDQIFAPLTGDMEAKLRDGSGKAFHTATYEKAFKDLAKESSESLQQTILPEAIKLQYMSVTAIDGISSVGGKLHVAFTGKKVAWPSLDPEAAIAAYKAAKKELDDAGKPVLGKPMPQAKLPSFK